MKKTAKQIVVVASAFALSLSVGCKKKDKDDDEETTTSRPPIFSGSGAVGDGTSLSAVYPGQLALAVFTDESGSSLRLAEDEASVEAARPIKERAAEEEQIASGKAESCFSPALSRQSPNEGVETCYEFDQDMVYGGKTSAALKGTKNGLNSDNEACMVAYAKDRAKLINDMLDKAKGSVATMLCQAKKANPSVTLPASTGEQLDLKEILATAFADKGKANIEQAILERLDDDADANPVFRSTVKMVFGDMTRTVILVHVPSFTDPSLYYGSLTTITNREGGPSNKTMMMTVVYSKTRLEDGSYRLNAELRRAGVASELVATAIGSDGQLDFNAHRDFSGAEDSQNYGKGKKADGSYYDHNADMAGQTLITFQNNPDTDEGVFSYWENPGSNYSEAARGMVANVQLVDGVKKGCATSGAALNKTNLGLGYSIASSIKNSVTLEPTGFYHPFLENGGCTITTGSDADGTYKTCTKNGGTLKWYVPLVSNAALADDFVSDQRGGVVTRQCYKFDDASGVYAIDTAEVDEDAGYELFLNTDTSKVVTPPDLSDIVKPIGDAKPE
jgi:hypothetical protein